jgi:hypothetical protein
VTPRPVKGLAIVVGVGGLACAAIFSTMAGAYAPVDSRTPPAGSVLFEGLPKDVVSEVLANPAALANVAMWPEEETDGRNALWQGMVINFTQCRQMLSIYEEWRPTGEPSSLPTLVLPTHPVGDVITTARQVDSSYRELLAQTNRSQLGEFLKNESGCGVWVPAKPGDVDGPVIADVVESLEP